MSKDREENLGNKDNSFEISGLPPVLPEFDLGGEYHPSEPFGPPVDLLEKPKNYEREIPHIKRTVGFLRQLETARPKGRENLINQMANFLTKDPDHITQVYTNIDLIEAVNQDTQTLKVSTQEVIGDLESKVLERVSDPRRLHAWNPEKIEKLFQLSLDGHGKSKGLLEEMKRALLNSPDSIENSVQLHYNVGWAMVETVNPDVREELFSAICYEKEWYQARSLPAVLFFASALSTDDAILEKHHAFDELIGHIGILLEEEKNSYQGEHQIDSTRAWERGHRMIESSGLLNVPGSIVHLALIEEQLRDRDKYALLVSDIMNFSDDDYETPLPGITDDNFQELHEFYDSIDKLPWPENVRRNIKEPLRKKSYNTILPQIGRVQWEHFVNDFAIEAGYKQLTPKAIQLTDDFQIEIIVCYAR